MLNSNYQPLVKVVLPHQGRRHKYHTFDLANPVMYKGYEDYLAPVVALCRAAGAVHGMATMTVDESVVQAGRSQRRPRPHVDGCFVPALQSWDHPPQPAWLHHCNNAAHGPVRRMAVIVAASVAGCRAWRGTFNGAPASDGDLSHIARQLGEGQVLPANVGYLLSPDCVHESMIFTQKTKRTFLRIALPLAL